MKTKRIKALFKRPGIRKRWKLLKERLLDLEKDLESVSTRNNLLIMAVELIDICERNKEINEEIINLIKSLDQINYKHQYDLIINDLIIINDSIDYVASQINKKNRFDEKNKLIKKYGFKNLNREEKESCDAAFQAAWNLRKDAFKPMLKAIESVKDCHI